MQRIFHRRKKLTRIFHIFSLPVTSSICKNELLIPARSCTFAWGHFFLMVMCTYFPRIIENSSHHRHTYLPPGRSRQFWSSLQTQLLCLSLKTSRKKTKTLFFYDFWSGLERCLEASASLLIEILTVNFRLSIDHRRFRASPLSGPKRTIKVVKMFCFSLYINCYY